MQLENSLRGYNNNYVRLWLKISRWMLSDYSRIKLIMRQYRKKIWKFQIFNVKLLCLTKFI